MSDIHVGKTGQGALASCLLRYPSEPMCSSCAAISPTTGLPEEARVLAREIGHSASRSVRQRCSAITITRRGRQTRSDRSSTDAGVTVLDGDACETARRGLRGRERILRRLRPRRARPVGGRHHQDVRAGSGERGVQARERARAAAHAASRGACCTTRRYAQPSKASRSRSSRTSAAAGSRSRSRGTR